MEHKIQNINIIVGVSKKMPDLAVCLSFKMDNIKSCHISKLRSNCTSDIGGNVEETALAYALYNTIHDKLISSPLELSKTRASHISCYTVNNHFCIKWNCQGTVSTLRKTTGIALSCLAPERLFSKYNQNIKYLKGVGGNKEGFNYCVKKMSEGIKSGVYIAAVGKINIDKDKLTDMSNIIIKKLPDSVIPKDFTKPSKEETKSHDNEVIIQCSPADSIFVADYIDNTLPGINVEIDERGVIVHVKNWDGARSKLNDMPKIKNFVNKKYEKLGEFFPALIAYYALTKQYTDGATCAKLLKNSPKFKDIPELIKKKL